MQIVGIEQIAISALRAIYLIDQPDALQLGEGLYRGIDILDANTVKIAGGTQSGNGVCIDIARCQGENSRGIDKNP